LQEKWGLRPALRGWKLGQRGRGAKTPRLSPTRLEGMETKVVVFLTKGIDGSPTRLEGMETH